MDYIEKNCENCGELMKLRLCKQGINKGKIRKIDQKRRFCCLDCQIEWQRKISWTERVGNNVADRIRKEASERVSGDKNPTKNKEIAEKVSLSLKEYLKENPRDGEKNPFYGKKHKNETIEHWKETKKGKRSYDIEGYKKLVMNAKVGEEHPNWKGGKSNEPYPFDFDKKLKKKIKLRDNFSCIMCGKETKDLDIHHINYIKEDISDDNLVSLCKSCHSKTNYNREYYEELLTNIIKNKIDKYE